MTFSKSIMTFLRFGNVLVPITDTMKSKFSKELCLYSKKFKIRI